MKNTLIFTPSKCIIARANGSHSQGGLFLCLRNRCFSTYKAAARLQYRTGKTGKLPRKQCVSTAVFGGPLFCLPVNVETHNAHRNSHTIRCGYPPFRRTFANGRRNPADAPDASSTRKILAQESAFAARNSHCKITLINLFSVT
jgi:hypothetical protein